MPRAFAIQAKSVILASGSRVLPLLFLNNRNYAFTCHPEPPTSSGPPPLRFGHGQAAKDLDLAALRCFAAEAQLRMTG